MDTRPVSKDLVQASFTLGASRRQAIQTVIIPAVQPRLPEYVKIDARLARGPIWSSPSWWLLPAVGVYHHESPTVFEYGSNFVGLIVIGLLGLISDRIFVFLNRRLYPWA